jgi:hypothetical protein
VLLALLTVVWGLNWPVMKVGVTGFPPLTFRSLSMWLGLPVLWAVTAVLKVPLRIERKDWREVGLLTVTNMLVWHVLAILAVQALVVGPCRDPRLHDADLVGALGPAALRPAAAAAPARRDRRRRRRRAAAALARARPFRRPSARRSRHAVRRRVWALGTQQLRHTRIAAPTLAIVFWMTLVTTLAMSLFAVVFEHARWIAPSSDDVGGRRLQRGPDLRLRTGRLARSSRATCRRSRRRCR